MAEENAKKPVVVNDGRENWIVYPDDNSYELVVKVKPDENGIRHVKPETVDKIKGWWYLDAVERGKKEIAELEIPWEDLQLTAAEISTGNIEAISERLARIASYIVRINQVISLMSLRYHSAKEALTHAVNLSLSRGDDRGTVAVRQATIIHSQKPLRTAKIDTIEVGAQLEALKPLSHGLETLWNTTSRVLTARLREPLD